MARKTSRQPVEILEERPSWLIPAAVVAAILIFSGIFLYYYFGPTVDDLMERTPRASVRTDNLDIVINGEAFVIPANFTRFARGRSNGRHQQIELHALMPDFEPFTEDNRENFESYAPESQVVQFDLAETSNYLDPRTRFNEVYRKYISDVETDAVQFGLRRYRFKPESGYENQELFARVLKNGEFFIILCERKSSLVPAPHCLRMTQFNEKISLTYRYKRPYLEDWRDIEAGLFELIRSFRRKGQDEFAGQTPSLRLDRLEN